MADDTKIAGDKLKVFISYSRRDAADFADELTAGLVSRRSSTATTSSPASRNLFWHDARRKLGKFRRLTQRDVWAIEIMLAKRIPKPEPVLPQSPQPLHAGAHGRPYFRFFRPS